MTQINIVKSEYESISEWFTRYSESFLKGDSETTHGFDLKIVHTRDVEIIAGEIAESLELMELQRYGARLAALLHDAGRFEQFQKYRTFNDSQSEDHGKIGIDVIEKENLLDRIDTAVPEIGSAVRFAVLHHNKLSIPDTDDELSLLFSRIVRDADRIDIIRIMVEQLDQPGKPGSEAVFLYLDNSDSISDAVFASVSAGRMVERGDLQGKADFLCMILSWIEIMNFSCSCEILEKAGGFHKMLEYLPRNPRGKSARDLFMLSMDRRLGKATGG